MAGLNDLATRSVELLPENLKGARPTPSTMYAGIKRCALFNLGLFLRSVSRVNVHVDDKGAVLARREHLEHLLGDQLRVAYGSAQLTCPGVEGGEVFLHVCKVLSAGEGSVTRHDA